jgi:hypothetical protein
MKGLLILGLFSVVLLRSWPAGAEMDGNAWIKQSEEFKRGYVTGNLDTETFIGNSLYPNRGFSEQRARTLEVVSSLTRHIARCIHKKSVSANQLMAMTDSYLRSHPTKTREDMIITLGSVLGQVCP